MNVFVVWIFPMFLSKCYLQDLSSNQLGSPSHQVNAYLAGVERKDKRKREIVDQFPDEFPEPTDFMDYGVTDIWWNKEPDLNPSTTTTPGTPATTYPAESVQSDPDGGTPEATTADYIGRPVPDDADIPDGVEYDPSNDQQPEQGAPDVTALAPGAGADPTGPPAPPPPTPPTAETTTKWTHPYQVSLETRPQWSFQTDFVYGEMPRTTTTTTMNPFRQQLADEMEREHAGYFVMFAMKLLEMIATKPRGDVHKLVMPMEFIIEDYATRWLLNSLGEPMLTTLITLSREITAIPGDVLKSRAALFYSSLKNRNVVIGADLRAVLMHLDTLFTEEQANTMFRALEEINKYPKSKKNARAICQEFVDSVLHPYLGLVGTLRQQRLADSLNNVLRKRLSSWRRRSLAGTLGHFNSKLKNYGKLIRRIFHTEHHRHARERKHRHQANRHGHKRDTATTPDNKISNQQNTNKQKNNIQKRYNIIRRHRKNTTDNYRRYRDAGNVSWNRRSGTDFTKQKHPKNTLLNTIIENSNNSGEESRLLINIDSHENTTMNDNKIIDQQNKRYPVIYNQNKNIQKRFTIIRKKKNNTIDDKPRYRNGEYVKLSVSKPKHPKNRYLRKIVENSDDSNERRRFRVRVYDALYHGNDSFPGARRAGNGSLELSSGTDEEAILKSNIYKYFGYNHELGEPDLSTE